jgi:hypothetical protein
MHARVMHVNLVHGGTGHAVQQDAWCCIEKEATPTAAACCNVALAARGESKQIGIFSVQYI